MQSSGRPPSLKCSAGCDDAGSLKNAPRGYPGDHSCVEDLKRKSLFAFARCTEAQVCADDFPERVTEAFEALSPLMKFMVNALGLDWERRPRPDVRLNRSGRLDRSPASLALAEFIQSVL